MKIHYRAKYLTSKQMEKEVSDFRVDVSKKWIPFNIHLRSTTKIERDEIKRPNCFHVLDIWFYEK